MRTRTAFSGRSCSIVAVAHARLMVLLGSESAVDGGCSQRCAADADQIVAEVTPRASAKSLNIPGRSLRCVKLFPEKQLEFSRLLFWPWAFAILQVNVMVRGAVQLPLR